MMFTSSLLGGRGGGGGGTETNIHGRNKYSFSGGTNVKVNKHSLTLPINEFLELAGKLIGYVITNCSSLSCSILSTTAALNILEFAISTLNFIMLLSIIVW